MSTRGIGSGTLLCVRSSRAEAAAKAVEAAVAARAGAACKKNGCEERNGEVLKVFSF